MASGWRGSCLALVAAAVPLAAQGAGTPPILTRPGDAPSSGRVTLPGNVHPAVRDLLPEGRTDPSLPMERMIMAMRMRPEAKARLDQFLADLQNPVSPRYHQWLTSGQFAEAFGPTPDEIAQVSGWLQSHGFTIDNVARSRMAIQFSGNVDLVEQAFRTPIMDYRIHGQLRHANAADPSIPAALAGLTKGVVSLHNIPREAMHTTGRKHSLKGLARSSGSAPQYTDANGDHWLAPGDFATIYDVNPLYNAGLVGSGVTIAIVGRTNYPGAVTNWNTFRTLFGLPTNAPTITVNTDPGDYGADEDTEADLDVEWSGAVAKGANIDFVTSKTTGSTDGADLSAQYIVDTLDPTPPIMSMSFSVCEAAIGSAGSAFYSSLWSQAAAKGITVLVASGDSGADGCDSPSDTTGTSGQGVSGLASTPYNVAVGGTGFNEGTGSYWAAYADNSTYYASALSYIPEVAWNKSGSVSGGSDLLATGGGKSIYNHKPSWQAALGVPADGYRDVPDVALAAASHDGYILYTNGYQVGDPAADDNGNYGVGPYAGFGGTSCSTPAFAGLMALVEQLNGQFQGNVNAILYPLANTQYTGVTGAPTAFHDITSGSNTVPGVAGFKAGTGYDQTTGLGSVDAYALATYWGYGYSVTASPTPVGLLTGQSATFSAAVAVSNNYPATTVAWKTSGGTITPLDPPTSATFSATSAGVYTITGEAADAGTVFADISVNVHAGNVSGLDSTPSGLDVLDLVGHDGDADPTLELAGLSTVGPADWNLLLQQMGWTN